MPESISIDGMFWVCFWLFLIFANMPNTPEPTNTIEIERQLKRIADELERR